MTLPSYRYLPGLQVHPSRHHAPMVHPTWVPGQPWQVDRNWLHALDQFDHRYYWEAHETLECIWHEVPRGDAASLLLQGLIQACALCLKRHLGQLRAAAYLHVKVIDKLERAGISVGEEHRGVRLVDTMRAVDAFWREGVWPLVAGGYPVSPGKPR